MAANRISARRPEPPLSDEQLLLAFRQQRRPHWPADMPAALEHAVYGPAIRGLARYLSRQQPVQPAHVQRTSVRRFTAPVPPTPTQAPIRRRFDAKRAAANDKED